MTLKHGSLHKSLLPLLDSSLSILPLMSSLSHLLFPKGEEGHSREEWNITSFFMQYGKVRQKSEIALCSCTSQYRGGKVVTN